MKRAKTPRKLYCFAKNEEITSSEVFIEKNKKKLF